MKILAVDYGDKNIGLAVSDPEGKVAFPHGVIKHVSKQINAETIANLTQELDVDRIVVGLPLDENGELTFQAKKVVRFIDILKMCTETFVETWDEYGTTNAARASQFELGIPKKKRIGHKDHIAAAIILQAYLESKNLKKDEG